MLLKLLEVLLKLLTLLLPMINVVLYEYRGELLGLLTC